jgi:hypothetical protein
MIWILMGVVPLLLFFLSAPLVFRSRKKAEQTEAVNNARELHKALYEFHVEYGSYPSPSTIPLVIENTRTTLALGTKSSNDYFRQLIAAGVSDERMFYSGSKKFRRPDGHINGGEALKKGEVGFAYIVGISDVDGSGAPLVIGPIIPGKKRFDPKPFQGKVVVLRVDGSATSLTLRKDGWIALGGGWGIDPANPEWYGKPITIAWPE